MEEKYFLIKLDIRLVDNVILNELSKSNNNLVLVKFICGESGIRTHGTR